MSELAVPKRKVRVRVRLMNRSMLDGQIYVATKTSRGTSEQVVDRLNDIAERFLPFAMENRHILLNKANIITVEVSGPAAEGEKPYTTGLDYFDLEFWAPDGGEVPGRAYALVEPAHSRALDVMNRTTARFVSLVQEDRVVIVNLSYVVAILEKSTMSDRRE